MRRRLLLGTATGALAAGAAKAWFRHGGGGGGGGGSTSQTLVDSITTTETLTASVSGGGSPQITVNQPSGLFAGAAFGLTGTFSNYSGAPSAMDYTVNGGTTWTALAHFSASGSGSGTWTTGGTDVAGLSAGSYTLEVRDHVTQSITASTPVTVGSSSGVSYVRNAPAYANGSFTLGQRCTNAGNAYICVQAGTASTAPTGTGTNISGGGTVLFNFSSPFNYSTISLWSAANQGTLANPITAVVANDVPGTDYGPAAISGITTSSTNDITVTVLAGDSFADHPTNALGEPTSLNGVNFFQPNNTTNVHALSITTDYVNVSRIQTANHGDEGADIGSHGLHIAGNGVQITSNCLLSGANGHESAGLSPSPASGYTQVKVYNTMCIWPDRSGQAGNEHRGIFGGGWVSSSVFEGLTVAVPVDIKNTGTAHDFAMGATYIQPCIQRNIAFFGFTNVEGYPPYTSAHNVQCAADGHCAMDTANLGFSNAPCATVPQMTVSVLYNVPYTTATFVQPSDAGGALDLRIVAGSQLVGAGSSSVDVNTDIFGRVRPSGTYDIGCYQYSTPSTANNVNIHNAPAWSAGTIATGARVTANGNAYQCTNGGTTSTAPSGTTGTISGGGTVTFEWLSSFDFSTANLWVAANQGTLTVNKTLAHWNDLPGTPYGAVNIAGVVTTSTASIIFTAAPGESFSTNANRATNKLYYNPSYGVAFQYHSTGNIDTITAITNYMTVTGIQAAQTGPTDAGGVFIQNADRVTVAQNIIAGGATSRDGSQLTINAPSGGACYSFIRDNLITTFDPNNTGVTSEGVVLGAAAAGSVIENNSIVSPSNFSPGNVGTIIAFYATGNLVVHNNTIFNMATPPFGFPNSPAHTWNGNADGHDATDYVNFSGSSGGGNATGAGLSVTTGMMTSVSFTTATFNQPSNASGNADFRLPAGSPLLNSGSGRTGMVLTNILGQPRDPSVPNIGCW